MIDWDDSMSSGIEEVDAQHREFIKLIGRLQILHEKKSAREFTFRYLQEISKYAEFHFISEENLMFVAGYPDIARHRSEHRRLIHSLSSRIAAFEDDRESLESLLEFLTRWVWSHTREEDSKIGRYLNTPAPHADSPAKIEP